MTTTSPSARPRALARPTWHRAYYALGAFNVISVLVAIALSYQAMSGFSSSIRINEQWAERLGRYSELVQIASQADAPGNDVFENGDIEGEAARLVDHRTRFEHGAADAVDELTRSVAAGTRAPLVDKLATARTAFADMMASADRIFEAFRRGDRGDAGHHMAVMDRNFSQEMTAAYDAGDLVLRVSDDGIGVDWDRVRDKARALGVPCDTERELCAAIFHDGLSTRDQVSETSGRGVGLSALAEVVDELGGQVAVQSEAGRGATLEFRFAAQLRRPAAIRQSRSSLLPRFH